MKTTVCLKYFVNDWVLKVMQPKKKLYFVFIISIYKLKIFSEKVGDDLSVWVLNLLV